MLAMDDIRLKWTVGRIAHKAQSSRLRQLRKFPSQWAEKTDRVPTRLQGYTNFQRKQFASPTVLELVIGDEDFHDVATLRMVSVNGVVMKSQPAGSDTNQTSPGRNTRGRNLFKPRNKRN